MIDPLETAIAYLRAQTGLTTLVAGRIASKAHYGAGPGAWPQGATSIVVTPSEWFAEVDVPVQPTRLAIRCYAEDQARAMEVWREVVEVSRAHRRCGVDTSEGRALLHSFVQASTPSLLYDPDVQMDVCLAFFAAMVSEQALDEGEE